MCMEDIRVARETIVFRYRYTVPAGESVQVLQGAPDRVSFFIPADGTAITLGADTVDLGAVTAGTILLAFTNLRMTLATDGSLVTFPWFVMNSGLADVTLTVFETRLRKE